MGKNCFYLKVSLLVVFLFTFRVSLLPAATPKGQEIEQLQQDISTLENALKMLSDEKQRSICVSQIESLLAAKKGMLAQEAAAVSIKKNDRPLNFIQLFQNVKKILSHFSGLLKEKVSHLSTDYAELENFFSSRENLLMLLDIFLKLLVSFILGLILWLISRKITGKWMGSFHEREKFSLYGKIKALLFRLFLEFQTLAILFFLSWIILKSLFQETVVSVVLYALGAWFVYRLLGSLCRLLLFPEEVPDPKKVPEIERLFHLEEYLAVYILTWCRRILLLSLWAFILIRISSLFGLEQISAVLVKAYKVGIVTCLAIILTRWKEEIRQRFSFTLKEGDADWKANMKRACNHLLGKAYLVLIFFFSAIVILDLLGHEQAAQFALSAAIKSLLVVALAAIAWRTLNKLFQKLSALSREMVRRYPDLEKKINQYVAWTGYLVRSSIILLTLLIIMNIWNPDAFTFVTRHLADLSVLLRIPALILGSIVLIQAITFLVQKMTRRIAEARILKEEAPGAEIEKQMNTIGGILYKTAAVFIWSVTGTMILKELGFSIGPLLAGAGVAGLAVGFGAQNLVRDIIGGLFIIGENQIRVGDVAILNGTGGFVEAVNLRTTVLRSQDGTVHVFPNGTINTVSNMTHGFSYYMFDVSVAYKEDVDRVSAVLQEIGDQIAQEEPYKSMILAPFEVIGLDKFGESSMVIKARIKTQPIKQWQVGREMNRRIKKRFDELGIEIPFPHRSIYIGEKNRPLDINIKSLGEEHLSPLKDFIRATIKETLAEDKEKRK